MCSSLTSPFCLQQDNVIAVPILHYTMEMAAEVKRVFDLHQPDCVAVELPETLQPLFLRAAGRLPDISVVMTGAPDNPRYYLAEACDASFEALRGALENNKPAFCIDLNVEGYPEHQELFPDSYAITHIGYSAYYDACMAKYANPKRSSLDRAREMHMALRIKELTLRFDKVLFVGGMYHVESILQALRLNQFSATHTVPEAVKSGLFTLNETSCREGMAEFGWITRQYEEWRKEAAALFPDRQRMIYQLYDVSGAQYREESGNPFPRYHLRNLMKFSRNYAIVAGRLMPDLFRLVTAARGCVDANYGYAVWKCATDCPFLRNIDNLPALSLTPKQLWGASKTLKFRLRQHSRKGQTYTSEFKRREKSYAFTPLSRAFMCSYPPEDIVIERFGDHLKKRGMQLMLEEQMRVIPFASSLEEGIDMRETIRHWQERKLFVRKQGRPTGQVGAMVVIFDADLPPQQKIEQESEHSERLSHEPIFQERYPWKMTWIGEHTQESDMAFYATSLGERVIGPGISRCEYGGFLLSYPPRRLMDVWQDEDYQMCTSKPEVLLMSAIDYSLQPVVLYVAKSPPPSRMKSFAARFGKRICYIPLSQLSPPLMQKIRVFHVLDGHHRRDIAGEYII